jgi:hypothetical protein
MDQYMALSKKDLMIHITLNELYNTHSLILQHIETLVRTVTAGVVSLLTISFSVPQRQAASPNIDR